MCGKIETIETHIHPPWWTQTAKIKIETTKGNAKDQYVKIQLRSNVTTVTIYTDGSGIENKIGAAAYNAATNAVTHQHLGSETEFNMYMAELTALHLAV